MAARRPARSREKTYEKTNLQTKSSGALMTDQTADSLDMIKQDGSTGGSLPEIGRKFGGRDHTTVMHAVKKIEELKLKDISFNEDIELLKRLIDS